ncbi:ester cyclase [Mycobacterium sp. WMMD1722]|uniref:ester cyclase n=1 Tax=Mycobacterium sp. WMMD1722 TaxID=3404117 RepID=UPI003BF471D6
MLETQDRHLAERIVAPDNDNRTATASPPACRIPGPAGALASSAWLRLAFPDLSFVHCASAAHQGMVWLRVRMRGTHTGPFVRYAEGSRAEVIPPSGRRIDVEQIHLVTVRDGLVVAHDAVRDDLGMLGQLGVFPPGCTLAAMLGWRLTGRAARARRRVSAIAAAAASTRPPEESA